MTGESTIDYEGLAQEAMRGVVRKVLTGTVKTGLAGDHHFYISFDTEAPGVTISKRLKEKYPREMTIVLQHRFWDLAVTDDRFEVKLTFDGIPERLVVPFASIKVFFDPSVRFGLQFEDPNAGSETQSKSASGPFESLASRAGATRATHTRKANRNSRKPQVVEGDKPTASNEAAPAASLADAPSPAALPKKAAADDIAKAASDKTANDAHSNEMADDLAQPAKPAGAEIVSLDKFRKK